MNTEEYAKHDAENLSTLYIQQFGTSPCSITPLAGGGGTRRYYVLTDGEGSSVVGAVGPDREENHDFISLAKLVKGAPEVYCHNSEEGSYIIEDFGRESLLDRVLRNPFRIREIEGMLCNLMEQLVRVQTDAATIAHVRWKGRCFSEALVRHDLEYFRREFLERTSVKYSAEALQADFDSMERKVLALPEALWGFMYRDFQGRNVLLKGDGSFGLIDFQAGMEGPCVYDVASMLWQAKARYTPRMRRAVIAHYAKVYAAAHPQVNAVQVAQAVEVIAPLRILQTLGAYGRRGLGEGKRHFIESINAGVENLRQAAVAGMLDDYPELRRVAEALAHHFLLYNKVESDPARLTVTVESFSYRAGYPEDTSGNGGGFIFDCRWMHNPGRYDRYKSLTGMDEPVVEFLEQQGEIQGFMETAMAVVTPAVEKYIKRGFSSLYVGFGCTGGQHRSVYSAQALAAGLRESFPQIRIVLRHTRQDTMQSANPII